MRILKYESVAFNRRGRYLFGIIIFCSLFLFVGCINGSKKKKENTTESRESTGNSETKPRAKFPIVLDYTKDYPTKDIDLAEIADIEYVSFKDEGVLFDASAGIGGISISDKYIILANNQEGTIFVFDRKGKLINKFNKVGRSGEEYISIKKITADFKNREIFIFQTLKYKIMVYSFEGEFRRSFKIPKPLWVETLVDYNEKYLLAHFYVPKHEKAKPNPIKTDNVLYYLISKSNGEFTPIENIVPKEYVSQSVITTLPSGVTSSWGLQISPIVTNGSEILISDFGYDTIYINSRDKFTPFIIRKPSVVYSDEPTLVWVSLKTDKYTFVDKCIRTLDDRQDKEFVIDNHTGEIFEANLYNNKPDKSIILNGFRQNTPQNYVVNLMPTFRYVEHNEKGNLNGKLKEFVSTLKDDDNNFLRIIKFKD